MNKDIITLEDLVGIAEECDWTVHVSFSNGSTDLEFQKHSPAGEDFMFSVQSDAPQSEMTQAALEAICDQVSAYSADFDTEEHIKGLLDAKAHGFGGVPRIKELVEDADAIQQMLRELSEFLLYGRLCDKSVYEVTIERTGVVFVKAESVAAAMELAYHLTTDEISWSDDWSPTDATETPDYDGVFYTEPSF